MKSKHAFLSVAIGASAIFIQSGCSTPAKPESMTVASPLGITKQHADPISVHVSGGKDTNPAWTSQISDADFTTAIESSIRQSGLFSGVVGRDGGTFHLEVMLVRVAQPIAGFSMTVTVEVNWTLSRSSDKSVVWQKAVISNHTATTGDAFAGVTRLRMATEGAARKNIEQALQQISQLDL